MNSTTQSIARLAAWLVAGVITSTASTGHADDSVWARDVGKILPTDETVWCAPTTYSNDAIFHAAARLQKRATDGTIITDDYSDATTTVRLKMQCMDVSSYAVGAPVVSNWGDTANITCPAGAVGVHIACMMRSTDGNPFVYGGTLGGDPCGDGISEITLPAGSNGYKGQVTGYTSELNFRASAGNELFNSALMTTARVHGTDLGFLFYAGGSLWAGYGDTWANRAMFPTYPTQFRSSVLFGTQDLDPSDSNGLRFSSYHGSGLSPAYAREVVPSCHNTFPPCSEDGAIATAGFALREGDTSYRVLWFDSLKWIPVYSSNVATLAWSANGGSFQRADKDPIPGGTIPPLWADASHFGAGGIWQDRLGGYIYFFGQKPYQPNTPIRLARVPAKLASVLDRTQYEYWSGAEWIKDSTNPMAPSEGDYFGPAATSPANIIPASVDTGPELSVAFDAYANRFVMMLVSNRNNFNSNLRAVEVWQSSYVTGPWTKVTNGANRLPNVANPTGGQWPFFNFFYGPYTSEHLMRNGGQSVYYQLSEWNDIIGFRPYNVGLWTFDVDRAQVSDCTPGP